METNEIRKHHHRALMSLNAYISEKPKAGNQIARLHILVHHYEEMLRIKRIHPEMPLRKAA